MDIMYNKCLIVFHAVLEDRK